MGKYRVACVQWIDVYADTGDEARKIAGEIYYNADFLERESFPSFALAWNQDDEAVDVEETVLLANQARWADWSPNNDPF